MLLLIEHLLVAFLLCLIAYVGLEVHFCHGPQTPYYRHGPTQARRGMASVTTILKNGLGQSFAFKNGFVNLLLF